MFVIQASLLCMSFLWNLIKKIKNGDAEYWLIVLEEVQRLPLYFNTWNCFSLQRDGLHASALGLSLLNLSWNWKKVWLKSTFVPRNSLILNFSITPSSRLQCKYSGNEPKNWSRLHIDLNRKMTALILTPYKKNKWAIQVPQNSQTTPATNHCTGNAASKFNHLFRVFCLA